MFLLFDIGNTHTHIGLADADRVGRQVDVLTKGWGDEEALRRLARLAGSRPFTGAAVCSVVPEATPKVRAAVRECWGLPLFELTHRTVTGVGIDYPQPARIGPDRLANAIAAYRHFGAPAIVIDFGTAVTFDVVDARGRYVGGVISPGLSAMTDYLHEKTALLPRIRIRPVVRAIGRSTEEAMLVGTVLGYRGLIQAVVSALRRELGVRRVPVVATGGYAQLMAEGLPFISSVRPDLTLEGLRLAFLGSLAR